MRTRELAEARGHLSEALEQQTATSEVLNVISNSPGDLAPVFESILASATRICDAKFGSLLLYEGDAFRRAALYNAAQAWGELARRSPVIHPGPKDPLVRLVETRQLQHITDIRTEQTYIDREAPDLGFVPMVFNFDKPETKDFSETVRLLCNLSKFVIVDITNPRSAPLELQATVPDYMVPFAPILQQGEQPFSMFVDLQNKYDWVLQPVVGYPSVDRLIEVLEDKVVRPAEAKFNQLLARRTNQLRIKNV